MSSFTKFQYEHRTIIALFAVSLPLLVGCQHDGELGNLGFDLGIADTLFEFESGDRVLLGTHMCPKLALGSIFGQGKELACFDEIVTGPAQFDAERCWTLSTPGEVTWELTPNDTCTSEDPEVGSDRIRVQVVNPSDQLRLGFDDWRARLPSHPDVVGDELVVVGLAATRTLAELRESPSAARRVVAGGIDAPMLRLDDELGRVYFADTGDSTTALFELVGEGASMVEPAAPDPYPSEFWLSGERPLVLELGALARVRATLPGGKVLESPELIAVPPSDAASLDLMVMVTGGTPNTAYAELRDAQGRVLHGAPIEWSVVEGAIAVSPGTLGSNARTGEYADVEGRCEPSSMTEPVEHRAVLRARFGGLEDTVELVWKDQLLTEPDSQEAFVPDKSCVFGSEPGDVDPGVDEAGCACSSTGGQPSAPAWLGFVVLLALLPRRRAR